MSNADQFHKLKIVITSYSIHYTKLYECKNAEPNSSHHAIVQMEEIFKDRFRLVTQNVDGLHLRAGNSLERTFQIHGNVITSYSIHYTKLYEVPLPAYRVQKCRTQFRPPRHCPDGRTFQRQVPSDHPECGRSSFTSRQRKNFV